MGALTTDISLHPALRDENIAYAQRLMQAGVSTELHIYPGAFHALDIFVPTAAISQRAVSEYMDALKRGLHVHADLS